MLSVKKKTSAFAARGGGSAGIERPLPLYQRLKRKLSEQILLGHWPPGFVLPSEAALAEEYNLAIGTVRRALTDLTAEGMLSRRPKTGTTVTGRTPHHSLRFFFQFFRLHRDNGSQVRSDAKLVSAVVAPADEEEMRELGLTPGADVIRLDRIRHVDGAPVMHELLALPAALLPEFPVRGPNVPERIYPFLLEEYGLRITAVREQLRAELANAEDARRLKTRRPTALLVILETAFDQDGNAVLFGRHRTLTDRFRYLNEVR